MCQLGFINIQMKNCIYLACLLPSAQNQSQIKPPLTIWQRGYRTFTLPLEAKKKEAQRAASSGGSLSMLLARRSGTLPQLAKCDKQRLNLTDPSPPPPIQPLPNPPCCCTALTAGASCSHISGNFLKCHSSLSDCMAPGSNAAHADTLLPPRPVCPVPT